MKTSETVPVYARWFKEILPSLFSDLEDFPYALIKGPVLAIQAYGNEMSRDYHDIDFLIPKNLRKEFLEILKKNGFIADVRNKDGSFRKLTRKEEIILQNSHQDIDYIKFYDDIYVDIDINYDLFWGEYKGKKIDIETDFLSDVIIIEVFGQKVKALSKVKSFIQICLHHYREMNAIYLFKLTNPFVKNRFRDVYYLLRSMSEEDLLELHKLVDFFDIGSYIYYVVYYTYYYYKENIVFNILKSYESKEALSFINQYGLNAEERKEWPFSIEERAKYKDLFEALKPYLNEADVIKVESVIGFITLVE